jgi:hypothetical protein
LPSDLAEEYEEDGFSPMFSGLDPEEDDPLEEEESTDDIVNCEEVDEDLPENYMFTRETTVNPFLSIFMACERKKELEKYNKPEVLPSGVWGLHDNHQVILIMKSITFIVGVLPYLDLEERRME